MLEGGRQKRQDVEGGRKEVLIPGANETWGIPRADGKFQISFLGVHSVHVILPFHSLSHR